MAFPRLDVNECDIANAGCQQLCINSDGSYDCVCFEGYAFNENMTCEGWSLIKSIIAPVNKSQPFCNCRQ